MAQAAYRRILERKPGKKYASFAREFPTLVHSCGLAQALAFALAKEDHQKEYAHDLAEVLKSSGHVEFDGAKGLCEQIREKLSVSQYIRLSRDALAAAVWMKRYVEAAEDGRSHQGGA